MAHDVIHVYTGCALQTTAAIKSRTILSVVVVLPFVITGRAHASYSLLACIHNQRSAIQLGGYPAIPTGFGLEANQPFP